MANLQNFGKALRELRESRNITQETAVAASATYADASSLRRIERGEQRPRRATILALLTEGLKEKDPEKIDGLLILAGYRGLEDSELGRLGLERTATEPSTAKTNPISPIPASMVRVWTGLSLACAALSVLLASAQSWFVALCCLLYAGLYVISVLLESTYGSRRPETMRAAVMAGTIVLATSLGANWIDTRLTGTGRYDGLGLVLLIFVGSAVLQWLLVRPGLASHTVVPARFQSHTGQSAHLKNSIYFLFVVVAFWLTPRHCVEVIASQQVSKTIGVEAFCPQPVWLWVMFSVTILTSLAMGTRLLDNLRPGDGHNRFVILFYLRALVYFLLSAICLFWYSAQPLS